MLILFQIIPSLLAILMILLFYNHKRFVEPINQVATVVTLLVSLYAFADFMLVDRRSLSQSWFFEIPLLRSIGASLSLSFSGVSLMLSVLTSLAFCVVAFLPMPATVGKKTSTYYGLLQLCQFALYGVFLSGDAFFFYFFWELTLIPIYLLSSFFGGEHRIKVTLSFFLYTFTASLLMLIGFIYVYSYSEAGSFSYVTLMNTNIQDSPYANMFFWFIFIAFMVKMPLFPFHAWQAQLYTQAPTSLTLILSSVVAKMGLFGIFHWLIPLFSFSSSLFSPLIIVVATFSLLYGAVIALQQKNFKTLLAYSSLSHLSLMLLAFFTNTQMGAEGALFQMFAHGIVNIGLWLLVVYIENIYGSSEIYQKSGLVHKNPLLAFALVFFALANIGLPFTANFIGEWMMFSSIFSSPNLAFLQSLIVVSASGLSLILGAVYTLPALRSLVFASPESAELPKNQLKLNLKESIGLVMLILLVLFLGIYPRLWLDILAPEIQIIIGNIQATFLN